MASGSYHRKSWKHLETIFAQIVEGDAFIFELDANVFIHGEQEKDHFKPLRSIR